MRVNDSSTTRGKTAIGAVRVGATAAAGALRPSIVYRRVTGARPERAGHKEIYSLSGWYKLSIRS